ncbi:MAG: hypothetical protein ACTSRW_13740 [Candidatus Helarchaeota archaeon]
MGESFIIIFAFLVATWPIILLVIIGIMTIRNCLGKHDVFSSNLKEKREFPAQVVQKRTTLSTQNIDRKTLQFINEIEQLRWHYAIPKAKSSSTRIKALITVLKQYSLIRYAFLAWTLIWLFLTVFMLLPLFLNPYYYIGNITWVVYFGLYVGLGLLNLFKGR